MTTLTTEQKQLLKDFFDSHAEARAEHEQEYEARVSAEFVSEIDALQTAHDLYRAIKLSFDDYEDIFCLMEMDEETNAILEAMYASLATE